MHSYSSDAPDRRIVPWVIAACAVLVAFVYGWLSSTFQFSLPWWCETPTIMFVYGLLHWIYEARLWRKKIFGFCISFIPNCNGTWYGELFPTHVGHTRVEGMLIIHQTWSKIMVEFRNTSSTSCSRMAAINITPGQSEGLIYEYVNEPNSRALETMHAHRGFAFLKISVDGNWLEGDYYTGRDRASHGTIRLRLVSRSRIDFMKAKELYSDLVGNTPVQQQSINVS